MPIKSMGKKKDGVLQYRVRVNYTDSAGKYQRIERYVYGRAEAAALERELMVQAEKLPRQSMTLETLYQQYLEDKRHEVRETTLYRIEKTVGYAVIPRLGSVPLDRLNSDVLRQWKNDIAALDLSVRTKQNYYKGFTALLNYAVTRELIPKNPLHAVGNFTDPYEENVEEVLHYYTAEQYLSYARCALENAESADTLTEWGYYVFFSLAFYTGMRKGEINALRWTDIENNIIHVRHSVSQKMRGQDRETPPKNKSSYRTLQIPLPLLRILTAHRQRQEQFPDFSADWNVCGGSHRLRDTSIEKRNTAFAKAAGLPHIRIHDFRHSHASVLCNSGINIMEISRRLGHSNVEMTWKVYSHLYPREEERAIEILDKIK